MLASLLWKFDIVPATAMQPVIARHHTFEDGNEEDEAFPPLSLQVDMMCNCIQQPARPTCLINNLPAHRIDEVSFDEAEYGRVWQT